MKVNIQALQELIEKKYRGNQSFFAEEAKIDRSYLNQLLNGKINNNSPKICNSIIDYCEKNKLNYKIYIFLN